MGIVVLCIAIKLKKLLKIVKKVFTNYYICYNIISVRDKLFIKIFYLFLD